MRTIPAAKWERGGAFLERDPDWQPVEAVLTLVDATTQAALPSPFAAVLRGEPAAHLGDQILLVRRDGATLAFADSLAAIRDGAGAIARAHGGTVGVVSTAESGTMFTVRLPREPGSRLPA